MIVKGLQIWRIWWPLVLLSHLRTVAVEQGHSQNFCSGGSPPIPTLSPFGGTVPPTPKWGYAYPVLPHCTLMVQHAHPCNTVERALLAALSVELCYGKLLSDLNVPHPRASFASASAVSVYAKNKYTTNEQLDT